MENHDDHLILWCTEHDVCAVCSNNDHNDCTLERPETDTEPTLDYDGKLMYIIEGPTVDAETLFWSNEDGWGDRDTATKFTEEEHDGFRLPLEAEGWVKVVLDYDGDECYTPKTHEDCNGWHHCGGGCCGSCRHCGQ